MTWNLIAVFTIVLAGCTNVENNPTKQDSIAPPPVQASTSNSLGLTQAGSTPSASADGVPCPVYEDPSNSLHYATRPGLPAGCDGRYRFAESLGGGGVVAQWIDKDYSGDAGAGWKMVWGPELHVTADTIFYRMGFGQVVQYKRFAGSSTWTSEPSGVSQSNFTFSGQNVLLFKAPDGMTTSFSRRGSSSLFYPTQIIDAYGQKRTYRLDSAGRLLEISGDSMAGSYTFTYDNVGRLSEVQDPQARTTRLEYSSSGRLLKIIYTKGEQWFYYDSAGRMTGASVGDFSLGYVGSSSTLGSITDNSYDRTVTFNYTNTYFKVTDYNNTWQRTVFDSSGKFVQAFSGSARDQAPSETETAKVLDYTQVNGGVYLPSRTVTAQGLVENTIDARGCTTQVKVNGIVRRAYVLNFRCLPTRTTDFVNNGQLVTSVTYAANGLDPVLVRGYNGMKREYT